MLRAVSGLTRAQVGQLIAPSGLRSGNVVGPDMRLTAANASAVAADTLYAHPVVVPEGALFAGIQLSIGTSVAGVSGKAALYVGGSDGVLTLIEECAGTLNMAATANAIVQVNFAASRFLPVRRVWLACKFDGAAQPHTLAFGAGSTFPGGGSYAFYGGGMATFVRTVPATGITTRATVADTYAAAFPASATLTFSSGSPGVPIMGLVVA
jgi:hypothetical protein